jgi:methyl-accepting chemotaxis protein
MVMCSKREKIPIQETTTSTTLCFSSWDNPALTDKVQHVVVSWYKNELIYNSLAHRELLTLARRSFVILLFVVLISIFAMNKYIHRSFEALEKSIELVATGDFSRQNKVNSQLREVNAISSHLQMMVRNINNVLFDLPKKSNSLNMGSEE